MRFDADGMAELLTNAHARIALRRLGLDRGIKVVYFIRCDPGNGTGPIKIGWTASIETRMRTLQRSNPYPLTLLGVVPGDASLEHQIHEAFASARIQGEWFRSTPELLAFIDTLCPGGPIQ